MNLPLGFNFNIFLKKISVQEKNDAKNKDRTPSMRKLKTEIYLINNNICARFICFHQ